MLSTPKENPTTNAKYDQTDPKSILAYAKKLVGFSLREALGADGGARRKGKGGLGQDVEELYFGLKPNDNSPEPDFRKAKLELKTFPIKYLKNSELVAKERVKLGKINYSVMAGEEWEGCSFLKKNELLLLLAYLYEKNTVDYHDYIFSLAELWEFDEADLKIIKDDWLKIRSKIRDGRAHEISEGDTLYLGAVTNASTGTSRTTQPFSKEPAKPRALCLKQQYMNVVLEKLFRFSSTDFERIIKSIKEYREGEDFEQYIIRRFQPYVGKSLGEIGSMFGVKPGAKNYAAILARRILGIKKTKMEEFEKAGITAKTICLNLKGVPEEAMSFPAMRFKDVVEESWEESTLRDMWSKRFFFVVNKLENDGNYKLHRVMFWSMPESILDGVVREVWEKTKKAILDGDLSKLTKSSEGLYVHIRPHARDSKDTDELPNGERATKRCFWINQKYILKILADDGVLRDF